MGFKFPYAIWLSSQVYLGVTEVNVAACPCSVGSLLKLVWFLLHLHWLIEIIDLGMGGVLNVELLCMFKVLNKDSLRVEKISFFKASPGRPIVIPAIVHVHVVCME